MTTQTNPTSQSSQHKPNTQNSQPMPNGSKPSCSSTMGSMPGVGGTMNASCETLLNGFSRAMESWMTASRRMTESMLGQIEKSSSPVETTANDFASLPSMFSRAQRQSLGLFQATSEMVASSTTEIAAVMSDCARFNTRLIERGIDATVGTHAARTPEAFAATVRTMSTDCLDSMTATGERMMKLGTHNLESMREQFSSAASNVACCKA